MLKHDFFMNLFSTKVVLAFALSTSLFSIQAADFFSEIAQEFQGIEVDQDSFRPSPLDVNIGYKNVTMPVPPSDLCLDNQLITNPDTTTTIFSGAAVEPTIAVNPVDNQFMVAAWQQGRISAEGALEIGIARSEDGGRSWKRKTIPLQTCIGGFVNDATDVWASYSADGKQVYLVAVVFNVAQDINTQNQEGVIVSVSKNNGMTWGNPHFLASSGGYLNEPTGAFALDDKSSITADRNIALNAYAVWDRFPTTLSFHSDTLLSFTTDGGITWSANQILYNPFLDPGLMSNGIDNDAETIGNVIVVLPDAGPQGGDLLNFMMRVYAVPGATDDEFTSDSWPYQFTNFDIAVVRSTDLGITWDTQATVIAPLGLDPVVFTGGYTYTGGVVTGGIGTQMRTGDIIPSFAVNPINGYLYVAWQTSILQANQLPQIALSTSRDGGFTWSAPVKISRTAASSANPQAFTPFVAVNNNGQVGVLYSDFRKDSGTNPNRTLSDTWLAIFKETTSSTGGSTGIGLDFKKEVRLSKQSYIAQNGPTTTQGVMTNGDYSFLTAAGRVFYAVYTQSFNGPFSRPELVISEPDNILLLLDNNLRTAPFFSRINP